MDLVRPEERKPVRRVDDYPLYAAVMMARFVNATMCSNGYATFPHPSGHTIHADFTDVEVRDDDDKIVLKMPIYEAARLTTETD